MGQQNSSCLPVVEDNHEQEDFIQQTTQKKVCYTLTW